MNECPECGAELEEDKQAFLVVYHKWHVSSYGWKEQVITARNEEEARAKAASRCHNKSMPKWDFHIVQGDFEVTIDPEPRKLTLKERLTGKVKDE